MEQYTVTGMSCAACSSRVEKAVSKVSGVTSCSVSLLTNSMGVEGTASQSEIIAAVEAAGYGASVKGADAGAKKGAAMDEDALKDRETPIMKRRLIASPTEGFSAIITCMMIRIFQWLFSCCSSSFSFSGREISRRS